MVTPPPRAVSIPRRIVHWRMTSALRGTAPFYCCRDALSWAARRGTIARVVRVVSVALVAAGGLGMAPPARAPQAAVPLDPVVAILHAFDTHSIVGVGDPHGNEQAAAFRVRLISDPRVADAIDDIVVEFGNSRYQDVMDRFVDGEPIPDAALREVWQNTTVANFLWDRPIYEQFFRAVRDVNAARPRRKRLRVLLGDPPIDWTRVRTA